MDEGYILSNKYRRMVFDELAAGETSVEHISKKHHIIRMVVERVMDEFFVGGIVEKSGSNYCFTKEGKRLMENIER